MLQDVRRGQPTEIDAINGYLVSLAKQAQLACPTHESVIAQVKQRAQQGSSLPGL
jgi:ketopantoate reductase